MNTHEEWALLSAFLDGELDAAERSRVESHLSDCASCRQELESFRAVKALAASAPRRAMPADLWAEIEARRSRPSWTQVLVSQWRTAGFRLTTEAMAAAALLVGLWFGLSTRRSEELPLGPLLAAHDRYSGETLLSQESMVASNFSTELALNQGEE